MWVSNDGHESFVTGMNPCMTGVNPCMTDVIPWVPLQVRVVGAVSCARVNTGSLGGVEVGASWIDKAAC